MPLYLDRHSLTGATKEDVAAAHVLDAQIEAKHGVHYVTYWFDERSSLAFCLAEGPNRAAVEAVHRDAHGMLAEQIIEVDRDTVSAFMGGLASRALGDAYEASGFRAVLFTDVVGSTELTQRLGDAVARRLMRALDDEVKRLIAAEGGSCVKHTGDGIMASFPAASAAVRAALAIQTEAGELQADTPLSLRAGISAGEPVCEDGDLFGTAVQMAARLCALAAPGEVLVASVVRELCRGKPLSFEPRGSVELKGFAEPIEVHAALP